MTSEADNYVITYKKGSGMFSRPRITKEALAISVVVRRRARGGIAPFGWEVHGADTAEPLHVSPDRFVSMEEAYGAGQARLAEFIPKRSMPAEANENHRWMDRNVDLLVQGTGM
jgi:hypothetical protein